MPRGRPPKYTCRNVCLKCGRTFRATGPHNRVCGVCSAANAELGPTAAGVHSVVPIPRDHSFD